MSTVYFKAINHHTNSDNINKISKKLLETLINNEKLKLNTNIPLKVHFGEKGNVTFVKPENYNGIIDYLDENKIETSFIETSVMYGGKRYNKKLHLETARQHGFTRKPIIIADGEHGEKYSDIEINKKHFQTCKLGKDFSNYDQLIVLSHFKGHMLAGFGGAIKQLSMGFAAKGGKMAMHMGIKPRIVNRKCRQCHRCKPRCNEKAITIAEKSFIDHDRCVGCGACGSICPHKAISIFSLRGILRMLGIGNPFREKLVEYAYAAHKNKNNIYFNYAFDITAGCDCEPRKMKPIMNDMGIFVSTDPVAIDKACYDMAKDEGKKFRGHDTFKFAEKIGLGSAKYKLVTIS